MPTHTRTVGPRNLSTTLPDIRYNSTSPRATPLHPTRSAYQQSHFNNQQTIKKIREWFDTWTPWQQRLIICGLTDRCTTSQLESLATTLEPIFHRDYHTALRKRSYPTSPFKTLHKREQFRDTLSRLKSRSDHSRGSHKGLKTAKEDQEDDLLDTDRPFSKDSMKTFSKISEGDIEDATSSAFEFNERTKSPSIKEPDATHEPDIDLEDAYNNFKEISNTSLKKENTSDMVFGIKAELDGNQNTSQSQTPDKTEKSITNVSLPETVASNEPSVLANDKELDITKENDITDSTNANVENSNANTDLNEPDTKPHNTISDLNDEKTIESEKSEDTSTKLERVVHEVVNTSIDTAIQNLESINFFADDSEIKASGTTDHDTKSAKGILKKSTRKYPLRPITELSYNLGGTESESVAVYSPRFSPTPGVHRHRSTLGSAGLNARDFFLKDKQDKFGPMQRECRHGSQSPESQEFQVPIQRLYKNSKWWTESDDRVLSKPRTGKLKTQFKAQIKFLWEIMSSWESHDKILLLVEIIKLCDMELLGYAAQCLQQRLEDMSDINRLPDKLLLYTFSFLSGDDIEITSQVCRRWKYLCNKDSLWMYKCHQVGTREGIPNVIEVMQKASGAGQSIDWQLAYWELEEIVEEVKKSIAKPEKVAWEEKTPTGMLRLGGRFVPKPTKKDALDVGMDIDNVDELGSTSPRSKHTDSNKRSESSSPKHAKLKWAKVAVRIKPVVRIKRKDWRKDDDDSDTSSISEDLSIYSPNHGEREDGVKSDVTKVGRRNKQTLYSYMKKVIAAKKKKSSNTDLQPEFPLLENKDKYLKRATKKKIDVDQEVALDIRPELCQAKDILKQYYGKIIGKASVQELQALTGNVRTLKRCRRLQGHMDSVLCLNFDKKRLITGSMDRSIRVWDIRSGRSIHKLYGHKGGVRCLQFEGEMLVSGSWDMMVMVWELVRFERVAVLHGHKGAVTCLKYVDKVLVTGSHDKTVRVWSLHSYTSMSVIEPGHTSAITCLEFDGTKVITGSNDGSVRISDVSTSECTAVLYGSEPFLSLAVEQNLILAGNTEGHVYFFDQNTMNTMAAFVAHEKPINAITFRKGKFFTASSDTVIKEWNLMTMMCVRELHGHKGPVNDIKVDKEKFVSCSNDGNIRIFELTMPWVNILERAYDDSIPSHVVYKQK